MVDIRQVVEANGNIKMNKILNIFDWSKEIMTNKRSWSSFTNEEKNIFNGFMINKILSMNSDYIEIVNYAQIIPHDKKEQLYRFYCDMIPKKYIFSKFIKASKKNVNNDLLEKVALYYECSLGEAEEYISLLRKEGVIDILNKLGIEDKEQKKLIKEIK
jgi:hypothetical protein